MTSLQGRLLVASPKLVDPNFFHSVVLIVQHRQKGALGVVLNRPSQIAVRTAWKRISQTPCRIDALLHHGGPCDGPLMVVHTNQVLSQTQVMPGIHFSTEKDAIQQLVAQKHGPMKFFVGYAGWVKGQIEMELEEGGWLTVEAAGQNIFSPEDQWESLRRAAQRAAAPAWLDPAMIPDDPSVN
jgi:putative transcriptional regulator